MAMVDVSLKLGASDDENLIEDGERLSKAVDEDIAEFDEYFQRELQNDPMTKGEKAIIKTYLHYHLVHKRKANDETAAG